MPVSTMLVMVGERAMSQTGCIEGDIVTNQGEWVLGGTPVPDGRVGEGRYGSTRRMANDGGVLHGALLCVGC